MSDVLEKMENDNRIIFYVNFESENINFQSKKLISGGAIGLRTKCCGALCENVGGDSSNIVTPIESNLQSAIQSPRLPYIPIFHQNLRGRVKPEC